MKGLGASFLAAIALAIALHTSATAAVKRWGDFYEETTGRACDETVACIMHFSATPDNIRFSRISCVVVHKKTVLQIFLGASTRDGGPLSRLEWVPIPRPILDPETNRNWYSFVVSLDFPMGKGIFPAIFVDATEKDLGGVECKLTGRILPPGQTP